MKPLPDATRLRLEDSAEYQLAQRVLKAWEACPVDDNGFGETVILARAYLAAVQPNQSAVEPIKMLLYCPRCEKQHVDAPEPEKGWTNPPHATHTCKFCGLNWRPSNDNTDGVAGLSSIESKHVERFLAANPAFHSNQSAIAPYVAFFEAWDEHRKLPWFKDQRNAAKRDAAAEKLYAAWERVMEVRNAPTSTGVKDG